MFRLLKRAASRLPFGWQTALRRCQYTWELRSHRFKETEPEYAKLGEWVSRGDCVFDIGANVGHYTAMLSELVGPAGRVFALEPVPETFHLLTFNSRLFPFQNVTLLNVAASHTAGLVGMEIPYSQIGLPDFYRGHLVGSPTGTQVFSLPVDALSIPGRVRFVKIDVEGHEYEALKGMARLLEEHRPVLMVEVSAPEKVYPFLNSMRYTDQRFVGSPNTMFFPSGRSPRGE